MQYLGAILKMTEWSLFVSKAKHSIITVIQVYSPTSNVEEAEIEQFYEDLQDLLELTPKKDVLFIIRDWNAKEESQETPGVTGKFGLGLQNEAGQRLTEFCQENILVIANTLFQQHKRRLHMDITIWLYHNHPGGRFTFIKQEKFRVNGPGSELNGVPLSASFLVFLEYASHEGATSSSLGSHDIGNSSVPECLNDNNNEVS